MLYRSNSVGKRVIDCFENTITVFASPAKFCAIILAFICLAATLDRPVIAEPSVTGTIDVGKSPRDISFNSSTNMLYATNMNDNAVSVIDATTNEITATVPVGAAPLGIVVNPVTNLVYVGDANGVTVIDGQTNSVIKTITLPDFELKHSPDSDEPIQSPFPEFPSIPGEPSLPFVRPEVMAVNPSTNRVYVACGCTSNVWVIDGSTNEQIGTIVMDLGSGVFGLAVNTENNNIYLPNPVNKVSVIDEVSLQSVSTINLEPVSTSDVAINNTTNMLYVAQISVNMASVVDLTTNQVVATYGTDFTQSTAIAVNPATNRIFIAKTDGNIDVFDGFTNTIVTTLTGLHKPDKIAVNPDAGLVYVLGIDAASPDKEKVTVIQDDLVAEAPSVMPLRADFFARSLTEGISCCEGIAADPPVSVQFSDLSSGDISGRMWDFGDSVTSTEQNPLHTYKSPENYSVSLTISKGTETSIREKFDFIRVGTVIINPTPTPTPEPDETPDETETSIPSPTPTPIATGDAFTIECDDKKIKGSGKFRKLKLRLRETASCTLKLIRADLGNASISVGNQITTGKKQSIKMSPELGVTDRNREFKFTLEAIAKGVDWFALALPNQDGVIEFTEDAFNSGMAEGFLVRVK